MAERQQDIETLKRRGRRRLIGAVALVLAAVIVLPMVFDPEPRRNAPSVSVRIPGENETPFRPKPVPKAEKKAEAPVAEAKSEAPAVEKKADEPKPAVAASAKPAAKPAAVKPATKTAAAERARAEAALAGAEYEFQVGVFSDPKGAIEKLKAAKLAYYTESLKDNLTRVRAGPFATKEAAEKARERLKALGLDAGPVGTKS